MKKYRLPLFFATLFLGWLLLGQQIIHMLMPGLIEGRPPGAEISGRLFYSQAFHGLWTLALPDGEAEPWWQPPDGGLVTGVAASPDGRWLAIAYAPPAAEGFQIGTSDLYLTPINAPDMQPLLVRGDRNESYRYPVWSLDGRRIYFTHQVPLIDAEGAVLSLDIFTGWVDVVTGEQGRFVDGAEMLAFAPDGSAITYLRQGDDSYGHGVWVADADGGNARELVAAGTHETIWAPRFTPDGQKVIFSASGEPRGVALIQRYAPGAVLAHGEPWNLWQIDLQTQEITRVTPFTLDGPWPAWPPDGSDHYALLAAEGVIIVEDGQYYLLNEVLDEGEITWAP